MSFRKLKRGRLREQNKPGKNSKAPQGKTDNINSLYHEAVTLFQAGLGNEAEGLLNKILSIDHNHPASLHMLGTCAYLKKQPQKAIKYFQRAVKIAPDQHGYHSNLGLAYLELGEIDNAIAEFEKTLEIKPDFSIALNNLGNALKAKGNYHDAISSYLKSLRINGDDENIYFNLGNAYKKLGKFAEAEESYKNILKSTQDQKLKTETYIALADILLTKGKTIESNNLAREAIKINKMSYFAHNTLLYGLNFVNGIDQEEIYQQARCFSHHFENDCYKKNYLNRSLDLIRPLRVGYVSPDFREHSVAYFFEPLLAKHNRDHVESFCYHCSSIKDDTTLRLQKTAHHWRDISKMIELEAVKLIEKDKIDILVDLAGYTKGSRLLIFTQKPAPIQVSWLGYPNTTGLQAIDYRFTDTIADNNDVDKLYTETLFRLVNGFLCYSPPNDAPIIKRDKGLQREIITFASFNNVAKVNDQIIYIWSNILKKVPNSLLLLKSKQFISDDFCVQMTKLFENNGVHSNRIQLMPWAGSIHEHLSLYNKVDICLDTFPYNGTTTTCEALWMGVPVITLMTGDRHAGRVGGSILTQVGLEELITHSEEDYAGLAESLATNPALLENYHMSIRDKFSNSPITDKSNFALKIEDAYRIMWKEWCSKH